MKMNWLRLYAEFATDAKVQSMSEAMQRRLIMLFCLRVSDVTVTLQEDELAFALRVTDQELQETKAVFIRKKFIDEHWNLLNWDKRQYKSDSSAQRTAAMRKRKKDAELSGKNNDVTSQERHSDLLDTDTDTDTDTEKSIPPQAAVAPAKKKTKKTPIPENFTISENVRQWASEKGVEHLDRHFQSFVDKVRAKGYTYADWDAAFRNAITDDWAKLGCPARASPVLHGKFNPTAYVNQHRR